MAELLMLLRNNNLTGIAVEYALNNIRAAIIEKKKVRIVGSNVTYQFIAK